MIGLYWNTLWAVSWLAITEKITLSNFLIGYILSFAILQIFRPQLIRSDYFPKKFPNYFAKAWKITELLLFFSWQLILSNLRVAYYVIMPNRYMKPGVIGIPLDVSTDGEIIILANLITMTPGTLSLDVSKDRRTLYVHAIYIDDVEKLKGRIKNGFERRVLELMR